MATTTAPRELLAEPRHRWGANPYVAALRRAARKPLGLVSMVVLGALVLAAVAAPLIAPASPTEQIRGEELQSPSLAHPFGTDELGRDLLSRAVYGLRVSLVAGVLAVAIGGVAGALLGLLAGYWGGVADAVIMRIVDGLIAFPAILFGIALVAAFGPGLKNIMLAIAIVQIPIFARIARAAMLAERSKDYVQAAVSLGAGDGRIVFGHILINAIPPLIVQMALAMGFSVLLESSLSFLGIGIRPPNPSLGSILDGSRRFMREHLYYPLFPGAVLTLLLLGLNSLADTMNEALNPRSKK
jgi:peptide/nickel transport system permease protein